MILIPTVELREHHQPNDEINTLADQAAILQATGFRRAYLIDRDAQHAGQPYNIEQAEAFLADHGDSEIWLGGGIRDDATLDRLAQTNASQIVLGPMFWRQPGLFGAAARRHQGRLIALIAGRQGDALDEDQQRLDTSALELALSLEAEGASAILYLERERGDFYGGIDPSLMADLAFALQVPLFVSGGIHTLNDLRALKGFATTGIAGAVMGRALLDGRVDPVSALALMATE